jgi:hypothetical protein
MVYGVESSNLDLLKQCGSVQHRFLGDGLMSDYEERRLIQVYTERALHYSRITLKLLDNTRLASSKAEFAEAYDGVRVARLRCHVARLDLESYRTSKHS